MAIIKSLPSKGSVNYIGNVFELVHNILNFYFFLGRNFIKNLYLFIFSYHLFLQFLQYQLLGLSAANKPSVLSTPVLNSSVLSESIKSIGTILLELHLGHNDDSFIESLYLLKEEISSEKLLGLYSLKDFSSIKIQSNLT